MLAEIVFSWPGIGRYAIDSTLVADLAPLQAVVLIVTAATLLVNLLVDVSYYWFDPPFLAPGSSPRSSSRS
ncbi:MAG: peptide transporter permease [Chloroflexi bacterium]|nr:peptide transporter permease [Chloroflexota bacterium]